PWGLAPDVYDVTLITAAGVATDPVKVDVDEDVPTVLAIRPERLRPGGTTQVVGRSFHSAAKSGAVLVSFNGRAFSAESVGVSRGGVERLRVSVPEHLDGPTVAVGVVATSGAASETVRVPVIKER
ncbi:MAG: hypothetical protein H0V13_07585, partial [Nocardioidaceae bacterium]|nr:hypothetical protein [Nocardioidaceae bacterium]